MKNYLLILIIILFANTSDAQNTNYENLWKSVEKFELDGLPKSALKVVEQISATSKSEKNQNQIIKSLLFKSKFALVLEEDAQLKIITDFKTEITSSSFPTNNILENLLANLYWQYFQRNRWKIYQRTKVMETKEVTDKDPSRTSASNEDFRTWDLTSLFNEISLHYGNSLKNAPLLQLEDLRTYNELLIIVKDSKLYRPTLYDFLAHNALEFYKTDENAITKPAYKFEVDDPDYLSGFNSFSTLNLASKDSTSLQFKALKLYQDLTLFHLNDAKQDALIDLDLQRLKYVYQHATFSNKESIFLEVLQSQFLGNNFNELTGIYGFEIASVYFQQSKSYNAKTNHTNRWKAQEAIALCNRIINKYPKSLAAQKCSDLKQSILQETLSINTESYIPINRHSKVLVNYKNLNSLNFKIYQIDHKQLLRFNNIHRKDEQQKFINTLNEVSNWNTDLIDKTDYQKHSVEVVIPPLNNGHYIIYASVNKNAIWAFGNLQVTNLALIEKTTNTHNIYQVIDRNNGKPINQAHVKLTYRKSNRKTQSTSSYTTDDNGEISIEKKNKSWYNISVEVTKNNDTGHFGNYYISKPYRNNNIDNTVDYKSFLFTDRSIYRPGQTVCFKGIIIKTEEKKSEVIQGESVFATLFDLNGQKISELNFETNEFGSFSGEFIIPSGGLTGSFYIEVSSVFRSFDENYYISVEEYKRPKFEAKFHPVIETFKINDTVCIKGEAIAFAGSNITNAKVIYRVHRKVRYPDWYYWYRPSFNSEPQEITHGETTTDDSGIFEIDFKAIPDSSANSEDLPIFNYEIIVDITDLNGETRSTTTNVKVGYHALTANILINQRLDKAIKDYKLSIDTKNLNGETVSAKGSIKVYKLQAPNSVLRKRPWRAPDYKLQTKEAFQKLFPHEAFNNEDESKNWKKGTLVFEKDFDTETSKEITLGRIKKWKSGSYLITLESKDKFGQLVKDETRITVFGSNDKTIFDNQLFSVTTNKTQYKSNDLAELTFASAANNLTVFVEVEKNKSIISKHQIVLNNNKQSLNIPVIKSDLGGFVVHYSLAAFNSSISNRVYVAVPYPKTDLEIETSTFRDKLQPGTEETWSFKIKGPKGDRVSAELLASMYDASLDQFKPHQWYFKPITLPSYYSNYRKNSRQSFGQNPFSVHNAYKISNAFRMQDYDTMNWFGFHLTNTWLRHSYLNSLRIKRESTFDSSIEIGTIKGTVYDESGLPLPGVNIVIKGTSRGTTSDFDGNFSVEVRNGATLFISYIGFITQETIIGKKNSLSINLKSDNANLDEVVVVAYGTTKSRHLTGSVSLVRAESMDLEESEDEWTPKNSSDKYEENPLKKESFDGIQIRQNLQETAFFYPNLRTDSEGNVSFSFTTPEALTRWKLQLLAHTKDLKSATTQLTTVTQKELMVIPNAPRFLREGDQITISTKIANISAKALSGLAKLELTDALTGNDISKALIKNNDGSQSLRERAFTVDAKGNTQVSWRLNIPDNVQAVQYKILASTGEFSDGEQNVLPVLSNRMLVTETMPMWVRSNQTKTFTLDKLKNVTSTTLSHHKLTLEMTSNPAWYAVQALPYLMEYPYDCNEQTFSRYYANALASHIVNSNPRIQEVFKQWASPDTSTGSAQALISNLEKNQELKSLLIQETPWLRDAQSETEQKKRIALLFDLNKMNNELQSALQKLKNNQLHNGAWAWFNGGRENRFITQHIITGFGHLKKLNVIQSPSTALRTGSSDEKSQIIKKAIKYLDAEFIKEYKDLKKYRKDVDLSKDHLSHTQLHYLYMRSFFPEIKQSKEAKKITDYYHIQIKKYWLKRSLYSKGLMALVLNRLEDSKTAKSILNSLKENSITNEELGMYWKENTNSWYWYQAPIETQALMIEVFSEVGNVIQNEAKNLHDIDNLKIWLLKNKQTNRWKTTKATTEAVYALLLQGSDWLSVTDMVDITVGSTKIEPSKLENVKVEAGTGYFKTSWNKSDIKPEMAEVNITKKGKGIAWGGLYWQYFEDLDKITSAETPLQLKKKLFLKTNTDLGEQISEITDCTELKVGDLVRVRIELRSDRTMEFVHMKDMRASGLVPINVLSQYKWQDGLGYYESTKDASTNFFFDYLPKGVYVFEYDLRVNNAGNMSNGITTIQSMYAPEFSSHSEGVNIKVN